MTRGGMARHLAGCDRRREAVAAADAGNGARTELVHLQVRDGHGGDYWLNLEVDAEATLKQLDGYLRAIWLECCGHLSQFSTRGWSGNTVGMARKVGMVFSPGVELTHIYDFGTTSETLLKALDARAGKRTTKHPIALMARNAAPAIACQVCGAPATRLCMQCVYDDEKPGTLCDAHTRRHPHDEYGEPLAIVNSPRVGMCGYEGPAEPPY
ncbi:MAG: hypothetical protein ACJ8J0_05765 [Longimicrobiaceae bacterium]